MGSVGPFVLSHNASLGGISGNNQGNRMKRGEIVWHVVTGPECLGLVVDIKSWKEHVYAEVHWLPGCGGEELHEDDWFNTAYLRRVGESE